MKKKIWKIAVPAFFVAAIVIAMMAYLCTFYKAQGVEACFSSDGVQVSETDYGYYFDGAGEEDALVFYPGAKVDEKAYAPLLEKLAQNGVDCYLMKMPFHMAIFEVGAANGVIDDSHEHWYIGGHSMGGAMAASYLDGAKKHVDGIILFAAYSAVDLSDSNVRALSIYGDRDGVLKKDKVEKGREYFSDYTEKVIAGGNHAQFGSYGAQSGDNPATIAREEQISLTVQYVLEFIR